jgi:hypothetical protein
MGTTGTASKKHRRFISDRKRRQTGLFELTCGYQTLRIIRATILIVLSRGDRSTLGDYLGYCGAR